MQSEKEVGIKGIFSEWEKNFGYMQQNGNDLILTIIILYIIGTSCLYFYAKSHIPWLKSVWPQERCNPIFVPFAAMAQPPGKDETAGDVISKNFSFCVQNILATLVQLAMAPFYFLINSVTFIVQGITEAVDAIRNMINNLRGNIGNQNSAIMQNILAILIPVQKDLMWMQDTWSKGNGVFTAALFVLMSVYYFIKSAFLVVIKIIIFVILLALAAMIIAFLFIWPVGPILSAPVIALYIAISVPLIIIIVSLVIIYGETMNQNVPNHPG
jgi:hypothetical protein